MRSDKSIARYAAKGGWTGLFRRLGLGLTLVVAVASPNTRSATAAEPGVSEHAIKIGILGASVGRLPSSALAISPAPPSLSRKPT